MRTYLLGVVLATVGSFGAVQFGYAGQDAQHRMGYDSMLNVSINSRERATRGKESTGELVYLSFKIAP